MLIRFNKPYGVLSQFTPEGKWRGLGEFITLPSVYVAGRLDADSEGLLLLTDDGPLQARIADPRFKMEKTYLAQVEGLADDTALQALSNGVMLNDGMTLPARARAAEAPAYLWERDPPIRVRQTKPTSWIELTIREGRNRQVRRMTAAVGLPTLRLIRTNIGPYSVMDLAVGAWKETTVPLHISLRDDHKEGDMAKGEQHSNKMTKKPKKDTSPPKTSVSDRPNPPTTYVAPRGKIKPK